MRGIGPGPAVDLNGELFRLIHGAIIYYSCTYTKIVQSLVQHQGVAQFWVVVLLKHGRRAYCDFIKTVC